MQKVFPTPVGAPAYIRQCMGPMPFLRLIPTNTIDETNASEFLKAGAYALGFGVLLFQPEWMSSERYDLIEQKARLLTAAARGNV